MRAFLKVLRLVRRLRRVLDLVEDIRRQAETIDRLLDDPDAKIGSVKLAVRRLIGDLRLLWAMIA